MKDFSFKMPTRFLFGADTEDEAGRLVAHYGGTKVLILYGDDTVRRSGLLKRIRASLSRALLDYVELGSILSAPSQMGPVYEGVSLARDEHVDFVLALGDASVVDAAKGIAAGACYWGDAWDFYGSDHVPDKALPIGCVSTAIDSGPTASCDASITDKDGCAHGTSSRALVPMFSILDPALTLDEPVDQGKGDIERLKRILVEAASGEVADTLPTGLISTMKTLVEERAARLEEDPADLAARGELMWASTIVSSGVISAGSDGYRDR